MPRCFTSGDVRKCRGRPQRHTGRPHPKRVTLAPRSPDRVAPTICAALRLRRHRPPLPGGVDFTIRYGHRRARICGEAGATHSG
jgi:hypothetical protein